MSKIPLEEMYSNGLLESMRDMEELTRMRIPYEEWPDNCKIAGISEDLLGTSRSDLGCSKPDEMINIPELSEELSRHSNDYVRQFSEAVKVGWRNIQSDCRPDVSFRSMLVIMIKWVTYLESKKQDSGLRDIGRAEERLKMVLDEEIFDILSKHDTYWHSDHEKEGDKLDDIRMKLSCIHDNLWDIMSILRGNDE